MPKIKKATPKSDFYLDNVKKNPIFLSGNQFEIVTMSTMSGVSANYWTFINGKPKYSRVFIKKFS